MDGNGEEHSGIIGMCLLRNLSEMCSLQNKWSMKSTLFLLMELDGDRLESCCGVSDIGRIAF
jgi:hypothetical protein